jgi:hypothetical protein
MTLVLQRQLCGIRCLVVGERLEDLLPDAGVAPAVIAAVHRLPRAEVRRQITPGGSGPHHPQHAGKHGAMVMRRTTRAGLLRREQRGDARPPRIGQGEGRAAEDLDRERALRVGLLACPARRVAPSGDRLVPTPKGRPSEAIAAAVGWLAERQQQTADFRHSERDQAASAPFSSALA